MSRGDYAKTESLFEGEVRFLQGPFSQVFSGKYLTKCYVVYMLSTKLEYNDTKMKITEKINRKINKMPVGTTFKYQQLGISNKEYSAAAKAIERLIAKKNIKRISTGVFYKPKKTVFGELKPREEELLRPYLFNGDKRIAYMTGTALYNKMGLTTQVPKDIKVASKVKEIRTQIGNVKVRRVKSYIDVTNDNFHLLEILDVLKDFKKIPNLNKPMTVAYLLNFIKGLKQKDVLQLIRYALEYPPRTRAFLGTLLEKLKIGQGISQLKKSLNPLTVYVLGIDKRILSTVPKWNIK